MTMDERVEAAARTHDPDLFVNPQPGHEAGKCEDCDEEREYARQHVRAILAAAFPELHGDKTHWLAPVAMTSEMKEAAMRVEKDAGTGYFLRSSVWDAMRDAYLSKGGGG